MSTSKIQEIVHKTYITTDGKEFEGSKREATAWQKVLDELAKMTILDKDGNPVKEYDESYYVHIENKAQEDYFNKVQRDLGYAAGVSGIGHFRYDASFDEFICIESEIEQANKLLDMFNKTKGAE